MEPSAILALARDNKADEIRQAVQEGVPVSFANKMGQTALHVAALWGNKEAIEALLDCGADVNATNQRGTTPLHFAAGAKKDALAVCNLLLARGADPLHSDLFGYMAYEQAESPEVRTLLGGPDQRLFDFAVEGRVEELAALLASGAVQSLKVVDDDGRHVLNLAVKHKQDAVTELLLSKDPELAVLPDMTGNTALHWACTTGNTELVRRLLESKPELNMQNLNMCEYSTGNWCIGDEAIMPVDKSPLHLAVEAGEADILQLLLSAGARHDLRDYDGAAPIHLALENEDEEVLGILLAAGADPDASSRDVTSPLHAVAQRGPLKLLQMLLEAKADVQKADDQGWTPLMLAARAGQFQKVQALLAAGAQHAAANNQGNTALHLAAVNGHLAVLKLLIAAGADPALANAEGRTARDMAKTPEAAALLAAPSG